MIRWIPNLVTALRAVAGGVIFSILVAYNAHNLAFVLFLAAILTDLLDGWLARRLGAESAVGLWLDPLCDKLLVGFTWFGLLFSGLAPAWLALTIVTRNAAVAVGWFLANRRGYSFSPNRAGRIALSFEGTALPILLFRAPWLDVHWPSVGLVLASTGLILSLVSAGSYLWTGPERTCVDPST